MSSHQSRTEYKVLFVMCNVPLSKLLSNVDMYFLIVEACDTHGSDQKSVQFVGKPEVKRAVGSSKRRLEGSIKSPLSLSKAVLLLDCIRWVAGSNPDPATDHPLFMFFFRSF